jgi:hypothetical protein
VSYYRVKKTGLDNRFLFSNTIVVRGKNTRAAVRIYSNPGMAHEAVASISGFKTAEILVIEVTDMAGRRLGSKNILYKNGLLVQLNSICRLSAGSYILSVGGKTGRSSCRFIIIK